jgi:hypothetical protein
MESVPTLSKLKEFSTDKKKRLNDSSESAQLVDCSDPCADRVVVLNAIISPKVKALLIPVISLHFPNLSFSCRIDCGSSHCFIDSHDAKVNYFLIVSVDSISLTGLHHLILCMLLIFLSGFLVEPLIKLGF